MTSQNWGRGQGRNDIIPALLQNLTVVKNSTKMT